jgi:myo-inositol-1(or 4)-monophosphatase
MTQKKLNLKTIKSQTTRLIKEAGKSLLNDFNHRAKLQIHFKGERDIVTSADLKTEKIILTGLKKITPDFNIISEEAGKTDNKSAYTWYVDPLDGTTNFSVGNPLFATMITLTDTDGPLMTFIFMPYLKEFYFAERGKGAWLNGKTIHVSNENYKNAFLTFCHSARKKHVKRAIKIYDHFKPRTFDIRQIGSAAVEMAWVARGSVEAYVVPGLNSWDIVGGVLLVREAGGQVYDFYDNKWQMKSPDVCAVNKKSVYQNMVGFLKKV